MGKRHEKITPQYPLGYAILPTLFDTRVSFPYGKLELMQWAKKQKGFTIVELLIVVVVIAFLRLSRSCLMPASRSALVSAQL